jgi:hypothetical protein
VIFEEAIFDKVKRLEFRMRKTHQGVSGPRLQSQSIAQACLAMEEATDSQSESIDWWSAGHID